MFDHDVVYMSENDKVAEHIKKNLREMLPVGTPIYGVVTGVFNRNTKRAIRLMFVKGGMIREVPGHWIAFLLDEKVDGRSGGVIVHGSGMDMVFDTVRRLSIELYDDAAALVNSSIY